MFATAFLLLPGLGLLLLLMTHIEDRLLGKDDSPRPPRLRVLPGGGSGPSAASSSAAGRSARRGRHAA
ncbi:MULTISPECIES: hypothetical protein [Streptomyces]|uniref:Predicted protein n=1 Tax=Streptomyces viridosporus (strain ATCC 14672 / DSM 40746 / JCM 4963 / KCTC 9882 / NRRL B-12104 / FH 1290) TaxID=566461 RepID=D6A053_STRV1|nr:MULTISPECIES: hypothetical protein [Streptomyces]EFE65446.1 predicted protein [Streptomyces viridosporus ATCC 14672]PWJ02829.1 hypothetical protein DKG34_36280 [Streptomyces sp. NWU49]